ncbi:hypothetical protein CEXT_551171 [Caerostris extrusa]|uniref:Uncharacterized protein n=1 Tax=Caerostris extrusa TaxID=172846 RepID=A0AAV4XRD2_CAEEX|nr:hypothetical protein CEXT_551171 [Caerostris extrusa]
MARKGFTDQWWIRIPKGYQCSSGRERSCRCLLEHLIRIAPFRKKVSVIKRREKTESKTFTDGGNAPELALSPRTKFSKH